VLLVRSLHCWLELLHVCTNVPSWDLQLIFLGAMVFHLGGAADHSSALDMSSSCIAKYDRMDLGLSAYGNHVSLSITSNTV
jgi:hypothetical protein